MAPKAKKKEKKTAPPPKELSILEQILFGVLFLLTLLAPYYRGLYFRLERYPFLLVICVVGILLGILRLVRRLPLEVPRSSLFLFFFVLLYGLNVFFAAHHGLAHQEFVNWGTYVLFFLLLSSVEIPLPFGTLFLLFGANNVILVILGLVQAFGGLQGNSGILGMSFFEMFVGGRLHATLQYPNTASAYFGMGFLALLGVILLPEEKVWKKNLALFLAFFVLEGLFFTYSRGGMLVAALVLFVSLFILPQKARGNLLASLLSIVPVFFVLAPFLERFLASGKPLFFFSLSLAGGILSLALYRVLLPLETWVASLSRRRFALFAGTSFVAASVLFLSAVHLGFLGRQAGRLIDISLRTRNVWERLVFYRDGLKLFAERPLCGWGGGGWEALYYSVRSFPYFTRSTHNFYLQILIEGGILGILIFGVFLYFLFRGLFVKLWKESSPLAGILLALLLLAFLHGFVDVDFNLGAYQLAVWFFVACATQVFLGRKENASSLRIPPLLFTGVCLFFLVLSALYIPSERYRTLGDYAARQGDWTTATAFYEKALRFEPWDPDLRRALSAVLRERFLRERDPVLRKWSIEEGEKALRLAPQSAATLEHLGVLYAERGSFEEAFSLLRHAIEQNPFDAQPYLTFARVSKAVGEFLLARGEKEKAAEYLKRGLEVESLLERAASSSLEPMRGDPKEVLEVLEEIRELLSRVGE